jgi:hypothetical protein
VAILCVAVPRVSGGVSLPPRDAPAAADRARHPHQGRGGAHPDDPSPGRRRGQVAAHEQAERRLRAHGPPCRGFQLASNFSGELPQYAKWAAENADWSSERRQVLAFVVLVRQSP